MYQCYEITVCALTFLVQNLALKTALILFKTWLNVNYVVKMCG